MAADDAAFWIDYDYDRENASDGISRYGAYIRRSSALAESWDGTWDDAQVRQARFAEAAWATATTPVMSPGFVRRHPRVISAAVQFNAWDATLNGAVQLVTPWPHALANSRDWRRDVWWQDWPMETLGGMRWREPDEHELTGHSVPDGERLAGLPATCSRRPASCAVRPRRRCGGSCPGGGRDARTGDERRRRAGDPDPGAVLMPRRKAGAVLRHQSRGLTRTLPSSMDQAACASHDDPDLWFPDRGDEDREQEALRICSGCPVRSACLSYVLSLPCGACQTD